jgi:hypothetical protein
VDLNKLRRFSTSGEAIAPEDYPEAARFCHEHGVNVADMRFIVLESCFNLSYNLFGEGEGGVSSGTSYSSLLSLWQSELPAILDTEDPAEALALTRHLEEEIRLLVLANPPP